MKDRFGREINYMRISITDRCNLRCRYCMPDGIRQVPPKKILTYEQIVRICRQAARVGITRLKVTGGEPLVRRDCPDLIRELKRIPGIEQVSLTTNGVLLSDYLDALVEAGLDAVNISLDTLSPAQYQTITGRDDLAQVLEGIDLAAASGLHVKINTVLQPSTLEEWQDLVELSRDRKLDVRFIEMMPIGFGRKYACVPYEDLLNRIYWKYPCTEEDRSFHGNGPAVYIHIPGFCGSVGFISAIHGKFCENCNRIRLSSLGKLKGCLCYGETVDLMPFFSSEEDSADRKIREALTQVILDKPREHHFEDKSAVTEYENMIEIGG